MDVMCCMPTRISRCRTSGPSGSELRSNWPTLVVPAKPPLRHTATVAGCSVDPALAGPAGGSDEPADRGELAAVA